MSTNVKVVSEIGELSPGVFVTTSSATVGHWRQLAEQAAHALYKVRPMPSPIGSFGRVLFQFDAETFTDDLLDQAREAFEARWAAIAAGEVAP